MYRSAAEAETSRDLGETQPAQTQTGLDRLPPDGLFVHPDPRHECVDMSTVIADERDSVNTLMTIGQTDITKGMKGGSREGSIDAIVHDDCARNRDSYTKRLCTMAFFVTTVLVGISRKRQRKQSLTEKT